MVTYIYLLESYGLKIIIKMSLFDLHRVHIKLSHLNDSESTQLKKCDSFIFAITNNNKRNAFCLNERWTYDPWKARTSQVHVLVYTGRVRFVPYFGCTALECVLPVHIACYRAH